MKRKRSKQPANATAWCALHHRLMNGVYLRRRGCVMRRCKHLNWLEINHNGNPETGPNNKK